MKHIPLENGINKGDLPNLHPLLKQWQAIVEKASKEWAAEKDAPYWYNERASLGLLAGAIWQLNGFAFEEYSTYRRIFSKRGVSYKNGRCDIDFRLRGQYYVAESKQCWPTLGMHKEDAVLIIKSKLEQAKTQVPEVRARGYHPLAIAFAVPKIPINFKTEIQGNLLRLIEEINGFRKITTAWVFPEETRHLRTPKSNPYHDYFFPGVMLVMMSCKA